MSQNCEFDSHIEFHRCEKTMNCDYDSVVGVILPVKNKIVVKMEAPQPFGSIDYSHNHLIPTGKETFITLKLPIFSIYKPPLPPFCHWIFNYLQSYKKDYNGQHNSSHSIHYV